uniref:Nucleolar complex protein 3 homolog n=1 Tax=Pseudo-nitzschia australis TaxID=44445 RepID=A0A7S4ABC0_9STRA
MNGKNKRQRVNPKANGKGQNAKQKHSKKPQQSEPPSTASGETNIVVKSTNKLLTLSSEEKCNMVAELSELVLENPNKAFQMEKEIISGESNNECDVSREVRSISKVQQLLDLSRTHKNGEDEYIASLGIMSLLAIFKDILPSYRIRQQTEMERESKISKETKALWDYERALLTHYQQYLQVLEKAWERGQNQEEAGSSRLAITAMLSLCQLLKSAYHFNFRSNILSIVVRQMNNRNCDQVSIACCQAVEFVFEKDTQCEVAMEAARLVAKLVKEYRGALRPGVVRSFAKLPLRVHVDEAQAAKLAADANKKKRKKDRELADIESELREGSGEVDKIVLARCQSETLQSVILTYFRILRSTDSKTRHDILPAALEGLAKFSHLINIDTVVDLLDVLKELLVIVDTLPLEASLNCVLTAFQTLEGPGREMQIDQKEYIAPLYSQLARVGTEENSKKNTRILLLCLNAAFIKRREYSTVRVAAFVKQMFTVAMHSPVYTSVPLIALARQILQRYPSVHQLLESESDVITSGTYTPDVADPEHSNPFSTSAWELSCLKFHVHPQVREQVIAAAELKLIQLPAEAPDKLRKELSTDADEVYIQFRRQSKRHPLAGKASGKNQLRFITPRKPKITLFSISD